MDIKKSIIIDNGERERIENYLANLHKEIEKPTRFSLTTFGDNWKENARKEYDKESLIGIAWKQGRQSVLLMDLILKIIK